MIFSAWNKSDKRKIRSSLGQAPERGDPTNPIIQHSRILTQILPAWQISTNSTPAASTITTMNFSSPDSNCYNPHAISDLTMLHQSHRKHETVFTSLVVLLMVSKLMLWLLDFPFGWKQEKCILQRQHFKAGHQLRSLYNLLTWRQGENASFKLMSVWLKRRVQLFPYPSHTESALALFISTCFFILGNDLIRGFLVEHGALWLNGFMWSQSTQVCTVGCHFRSLSANPRWALGGKKHWLLLSLPLPFSLFYPHILFCPHPK